MVLDPADDGEAVPRAAKAALRAARPEINRFNGEVRTLLRDPGFVRTATALQRLPRREG